MSGGARGASSAEDNDLAALFGPTLHYDQMAFNTQPPLFSPSSSSSSLPPPPYGNFPVQATPPYPSQAHLMSQATLPPRSHAHPRPPVIFGGHMSFPQSNHLQQQPNSVSGNRGNVAPPTLADSADTGWWSLFGTPPPRQAPPTPAQDHTYFDNLFSSQPINSNTMASFREQPSSSGTGYQSGLPWQRGLNNGEAPGSSSQFDGRERHDGGGRDRAGKRRLDNLPFLSHDDPNSLHNRSSSLSRGTRSQSPKFKAPRLQEGEHSGYTNTTTPPGLPAAPVIRSSFQNFEDLIPCSNQSGASSSQNISTNQKSTVCPARDSVISNNELTSPTRVSLSVRLPRYPSGATPTNSVANSNQEVPERATHDDANLNRNDSVTAPSDVYQIMPTTSTSSSSDQFPQTSTASVATATTQSSGRGFSLSVEISGSDNVGSIDVNFDVGRPQTPTPPQDSIGNHQTSLSSGAIAAATAPSPPSVTILSSPPPPSSSSSSHRPLSSRSRPTEPGSSGLGSRGREEIIIVDSSDDEDDHTVIMFTEEADDNRHRHGNRSPQHDSINLITPSPAERHRTRRIQADIDEEIDVISTPHPSSSSSSSSLFFTPPNPHRVRIPVVRGRRRVQPPPVAGDSNLWSSRGPSSALFFLPSSSSSSSSSTSSGGNMSSSGPHMPHITPNDAHYHVPPIPVLPGAAGPSSRGGPPRRAPVGGANRQISPLDYNNHPILNTFRSIISRHSTFEELLDLADRLGPAHSSGLTKEEMSRLPSRTHSKRDGDDKNCVVCMSDFQVREKIRTLTPCKHEFHQKCIDKWLKDHNTCPICREIVKTLPPPPASLSSSS